METLPFGSTGHRSSRILFGAAALWAVDDDEAERVIDRLLEEGVNHIDVAASYGPSEDRLKRPLARHRDAFFLATKTGERGYAEARDQIRHSLERMGTNHVDLIQLHNLVKPDEWERALGDDGALRACVEARDEGLVRFIGVTGHGRMAAEMHRRSLERFAFDSVLTPYNHTMMALPEYAASFEALLALAAERGVAVQTIKAVARRRWENFRERDRNTWYEPFREPADIERAVHWALARPGIFVNTASDLRILWPTIEAARSFSGAPDEAAMQEAEARLGVTTLFAPGLDDVRPDALGRRP